MKNILLHLRTMEQFMAKFTSMFSPITIVSNAEEPMPRERVEVQVIGEPAPIVPAHRSPSQDEDALLAEAYVAEKLAESEMDDSQEASCLFEEYLSESTMTGIDDESQRQTSQIEILLAEEKVRTEPDEAHVFEYFPIKSKKEMDYIENQIRNKSSFRARILNDLMELKAAYGPSFEFTDIIERVMDRDLLMGYNWTGFKGKRPLKCYRIFNELLKEIVTMDQGPYEEVLAKAIATSHRRKNNQIYRKRRKENDENRVCYEVVDGELRKSSV